MNTTDKQTAGDAAYQAAEKAQPWSPLQMRLRADLQNLGEQHARTYRALVILEAHPEFELFIELAGLIRLPIRLTPIRSEVALVTA